MKLCTVEAITSSSFVIHFYNYLHTDFILVIRHPNDGNRSGRNMLLKNEHIYKAAFVGLSYRCEVSHAVHRGSKTVSYAMEKGFTVT